MVNTKNIDISFWPYNEINANTYVNFLLKLTYNSKLNDSYIKQILVLKKKHMKSAICFLIQQEISRKNLQSIISLQVTNYMPFLCNDIYQDILIEIYMYFNIPKLYRVECITGCVNFFHNVNWNTEIETYLNHTGLKNFLSLMKIDSNDLKEIIEICNFVKSTTPFVLFLNKYKEKNYYNRQFSILESCTYSDIENYFLSKDSNSEDFYFQLNQIENQRVRHLIFKEVNLIRQKIRLISQKKIFNKLLTLVSTSGLFILIILNAQKRYFSPSSRFAMLTTPPATEGVYGFQSRTPPRGSRLTPQASFPMPEFETREDKMEYLYEKFLKKNTGIVNALKQCLHPTTSEGSPAPETSRRSTDSTDAPTITDSGTFKTRQQIINGRIYNPAKALKVTDTPNIIDAMCEPGSEEKLMRKTFMTGQRMIRKKLLREPIPGFELKHPMYLTFIQDPGTKNFTHVTLIGNYCECSSSKDFTSRFTALIDKKQTTYKLYNHTFEHPLPELVIEVIEGSRLLRGGGNDEAVGPLMSQSSNKTMSTYEGRITKSLSDKGKTIFSNDPDNDIVKLLKEWSQEHQKAGFERIENKAWEDFEIKETDIFRKHRGTIKTAKKKQEWDAKTKEEKYKDVGSEIQKYIIEKLKDPLSQMRDMTYIPQFQYAYARSLPYALEEVSDWCDDHTGLTRQQTTGLFFGTSIIKAAKKSIINELYLVRSEVPKIKTSFETALAPRDLLQSTFTDQKAKTIALKKIIFQMKVTWPITDSNNTQFHVYLTELEAKMGRVNTKVIRFGRRLSRKLVKNQNQPDKGEQLVLLNTDGSEVLVDFAAYIRNLNHDIDTFENDVNMNNIVSDDNWTEHKIYNEIFEESNNFGADISPKIPKSVNPNAQYMNSLTYISNAPTDFATQVAAPDITDPATSRRSSMVEQAGPSGSQATTQKYL